jgi:uncharacterized protein
MHKRIREDLNNALKRGDKQTAEALRFLLSVVNNARISLGHELEDEEVIKVIRKEIKQRIESRDIYTANNRDDLAAKEESERSPYLLYVPEELTKEELDKIIVDIAIGFVGAPTFAQLMPLVIKQVSGRADGKTVAEQVKQYLNGE